MTTGQPAPGRKGVLVVGDLVTDVLVVHVGSLAVGSDTDARITVGGGGQAANTAAWLAQAEAQAGAGPDARGQAEDESGGGEGGGVTLIAATGDDHAGRERIAELLAAGVRCAVRAHPGVPTGSVVVLSSTGERTMITDRGAALLLDPADVTAAVKTAHDASHLHLSGYPLLHAGSRPGGLAALAAAAERGLTTSVDAASAEPLRQLGAEVFLDLVRGTDLLLCNADEAAVLAGAGTAEEQSARLARSARNVVVKLGADGAVWRGEDGLLRLIGGVRVPVIDPTGAGDAFAAGLLRAWCSGAGPQAALEAGAALGAAAVQTLGARPAV
ncbi:carbohydrate kinase family protein [Actinoplanes friuliensis]|uniref:Putative PfkB-family carbohydrate kinase n=1 Tax=Actinoplanes friuliensis DSM 7358 TaxID=1246995 RepID=U5W8J6_9ACTN|nr:PfkB family carbohydrate kinase [Actinoplanes friuliensis]AGZ45327.1 putative PfkB-family carbohydrate kinase [Actinoplanes friuliensis DSM 7358]